MPSPQTLFLVHHGGRLDGDLIADFGDYAAECDAFEHGLCLADAADIGLLRVSGVDAVTFLHNQLSSHVASLPPGDGQYSTYNSPKGRMLASLFLWRDNDDAGVPVFFLLLAADLAEIIHKRLSMYVLRAKVTLENVGATRVFLGLCGTGASAAAARPVLDSLPEKRGVRTQNGVAAVALSSNRLLLILPLETLPEHWPALSKNARPAGRYLWQRATVLDGISLITAATTDRLIPQSANWDALGGLDFQKGCYPGQEIVARTRYLGRTKERLYLAHCDETAVFTPATPLYSPAFGDQACGLVVNAAPDRRGQVLLTSFQTAAADGPIHAIRPDGPALALLPLPYELPALETPNRIKL